jgi:NTE family protein
VPFCFRSEKDDAGGSHQSGDAEWDFLCMLRDAGRAAAEVFLAAHGAELGLRSCYDLDVLLKSV